MSGSQDTRQDLAQLLSDLQQLRTQVESGQQGLLQEWKPWLGQAGSPAGIAHLAAYVSLRRHYLRDLQIRLSRLGLSSLGRSESHVLASLDAVLAVLHTLNGKPAPLAELSRVGHAMQTELAQLPAQTFRLFGNPAREKATVLMVTLPEEAADDYDLSRDLLSAGMDCARINGAHDDMGQWQKMIDNLRQASRETGRHCLVLFDLAGPKLRTGAMTLLPPVLHVRIRRDEYGNVQQPARIILDSSGAPGQPGTNGLNPVPARLAVSDAWLQLLKPGDCIRFHDLRKRKREFVVESRPDSHSVLVSCRDGAYLAPGTRLTVMADQTDHALSSRSESDRSCLTGAFRAAPARIQLREQETLLLTRSSAPGQPEQRDKTGKLLVPGRIPASEPAALDDIRPGQSAWLDDGRIGCLVERIDTEGAWLRITRIRPGGDKLGEDKGINFPDSVLRIPALTGKDRQDLDFAVKHADLVGLSFVQRPQDIQLLQAELTTRGASHLGIIAKIETRQAIEQFPQIMVQGSSHGRFGIMIARGDLAVETGFERMAELQEELLWLCEAAHIPVIWATQVLENLVRQNQPSRAEITDAAMSERAECVMLNKGPFVLHGMNLLNSIITRMQSHQDKKTACYRTLPW